MISFFHHASMATPPASPPSDFLNDLIAVNIILFILSAITEKITQLLRHYAPFKLGKWLTRKGFVLWSNVGRRSTHKNVSLKKLIEREVNSVSFLVGLSIACCFHVDLFKMFSATNAKDVLFWTHSKWIEYHSIYDYALLVISLLLTGFFLTFGSKFFHDLLDVLFQVKDAKRKLVDDNTYQSESIQSFDDYMKTNYSDIIDAAINQNQQLLRPVDSIGGPRHGKMLKSGTWADCIEVHLPASNTSQIPQDVIAKLDSGRQVRVPVNVIKHTAAIQVHSSQGNPVAAAPTANYQGTICCKVKTNDGQTKLLTCSHVMTGGKGTNYFGPLQNPVKAKITGFDDGSFVWAKCDSDFDTALILPDDQTFNYAIKPKKERGLTPADLMRPVKVIKQDGVLAEGLITNHCIPYMLPVSYEGGDAQKENLIALSKVTTTGNQVTYQTLTIAGDSGACVYDEHDSPIGMIIGGDDQFSYAVSMVGILKDTEASLVS